MTDSSLLLSAGLLTIVVALVHSILGEIMIFSRMRRGTIVPTDGGDRLRERHVRILWANWHLVTIFGLCFAAILLRLGAVPAAPLTPFLLQAISCAMLAGSLLVLYATKGRHPGWIGLGTVAILIWMVG